MNLLNLKKDIPASIVVFLVALPLCLGIALASGAPLFAGVISGILGGILVGALSKSHTSVSGPAAGLAAVVLSAITQLDSFEVFLTALFLAGILQVILGLLKTGFIAHYIPSNVIKGLLAAIGILLILKQIPHAMGYDQDYEGDFTFFQRDGENTFTELWKAVNFFTPGALLLSIVSMLILFYWERSPLKKITFFPASLLVVILGVLLNEFVFPFFPVLVIEASHLVSLPPIDTSQLASYLHLPDFSYLADYRVFTVALTIALVASLETLLNIEAVNKLDPHKRESPPNRELVAQGVGNMAAGLLGGLPITSVIVRSSVNLNAGNASKFSAILHGVLMLASVLVLSPVLNLIPLSSLAAILIMTGYKLAKLSLFKEMYGKGGQQFIPFAVTILAIVFTDLLMGILIGLAVSIFYLLRSNFHNPFTLGQEQLPMGELVRMELSEEVSFLNKASIKDTLWQVPENSKVIIDATRSTFIDEDVLEVLTDFRTTVAKERGIQLNLIGLQDKYELKNHVQFINVLDKETQQKLTPDQIVALLQTGNDRFVQGQSQEKNYQHQVNATATRQSPMAVIVACIDSRTSPEIVFDAGLGDLLIIRIAGNIASRAIIGSLEIAVQKIGAKLIVVMGHSNCGAIGLALQQPSGEYIRAVTSKIDKAIAQCGLSPGSIDAGNGAVMERITRLNARNTIEEILERSSELKSRVASADIGIVAAYYDTASGKVYFEPSKVDSLPNQWAAQPIGTLKE
ncbi:MAG: hypothetical protein KME05_24815 [Gloeocapsa sp. UFS-A4-WI-NPMV-4B04]|jgi:carbonic anhydrase|nr:hypothetical protein [Gloeocapsa sp. UFS-A4-WI-NPMV-4B04]